MANKITITTEKVIKKKVFVLFYSLLFLSRKESMCTRGSEGRQSKQQNKKSREEADLTSNIVRYTLNKNRNRNRIVVFFLPFLVSSVFFIPF